MYPDIDLCFYTYIYSSSTNSLLLKEFSVRFSVQEVCTSPNIRIDKRVIFIGSFTHKSIWP